ncbi:MAG: hypothetical protein FD146_1030 [Anaerolineaceae bacterium]|nr:MAG: hypothetical protein FD146_1030 [Anaerolineaceae bacterium]
MTSIPPRPIPESYWVEAGRFLAGEYPGHPRDLEAARRITAFLDAGFDAFFDLTQEGELVPYEPLLREDAQHYSDRTVTYRRFPIGDYGLPTTGQMKNLLDAIESALAAGHKIYLHCWGGVGRTGTTVGCWLVRRGMTGEQSLAQLAEWWQAVPKSVRFPHSPETEEQRGFILNWTESEK